MNERIKKLRKALDLTQQEFAERIGVKRNTIATYEIGRNTPLDAVITLICREFNASEAWLRTGEGEMFVETPSGALDVLAQEYRLNHFERVAVEKFLNLKPETRNALLDYVKQLAAAIVDEKSDAATSDILASPTIEDEARTEAGEFYRQRLMEKKVEDTSLASPSDTGSDDEKMA